MRAHFLTNKKTQKFIADGRREDVLRRERRRARITKVYTKPESEYKNETSFILMLYSVWTYLPKGTFLHKSRKYGYRAYITPNYRTLVCTRNCHFPSENGDESEKTSTKFTGYHAFYRGIEMSHDFLLMRHFFC